MENQIILIVAGDFSSPNFQKVQSAVFLRESSRLFLSVVEKHFAAEFFVGVTLLNFVFCCILMVCKTIRVFFADFRPYTTVTAAF